MCNKRGESLSLAVKMAAGTWKKRDGPPMVDYSIQAPYQRRGSHGETIDRKNFIRFLKDVYGFDFDIMLEIKDKENSALKALEYLKQV